MSLTKRAKLPAAVIAALFAFVIGLALTVSAYAQTTAQIVAIPSGLGRAHWCPVPGGRRYR